MAVTAMNGGMSMIQKLQNKFPIYRIGFGRHPEGLFIRLDVGMRGYRWTKDAQDN